VFNISATLVSATGYMTDAQNPTGYAQVLEERINTTAGTTVKLYAYGSDLISQSVVSGPSSVVTHYHAYDGLGSVRALTNAAGTITDSYDYDAFGILIYSSTSTSNLNTDYLYRGERFDSDIGQYSLRARFYNQATGRFWNQDTYEGSASDPMSLHKYLYASGNPVMGFDPSGRMTLVESVKTAGIVGTLAILTMPQVMQMGVRAVSTIIEAGLYGAGQATESIYGRLPAYTLTLKIEKANARVIPAEEEKRRGRSAVIGENMIRTGFAGFYLGAETFAPIEFGGEMLPEEMTTQEDFNLWMWANRAWIRSVMARGMRIYDIGRDMTRVAQGKKVSQFYAMESEETAAYLFKTNYYWPPSDPFGK
jgi:RHS repeat-associated protein